MVFTNSNNKKSDFVVELSSIKWYKWNYIDETYFVKHGRTVCPWRNDNTFCGPKWNTETCDLFIKSFHSFITWSSIRLKTIPPGSGFVVDDLLPLLVYISLWVSAIEVSFLSSLSLSFFADICIYRFRIGIWAPTFELNLFSQCLCVCTVFFLVIKLKLNPTWAVDETKIVNYKIQTEVILCTPLVGILFFLCLYAAIFF